MYLAASSALILPPSPAGDHGDQPCGHAGPCAAAPWAAGQEDRVPHARPQAEAPRVPGASQAAKQGGKGDTVDAATPSSWHRVGGDVRCLIMPSPEGTPSSRRKSFGRRGQSWQKSGMGWRVGVGVDAALLSPSSPTRCSPVSPQFNAMPAAKTRAAASATAHFNPARACAMPRRRARRK